MSVSGPSVPLVSNKSKEEDKDQELMQSSNIPLPWNGH